MSKYLIGERPNDLFQITYSYIVDIRLKLSDLKGALSLNKSLKTGKLYKDSPDSLLEEDIFTRFISYRSKKHVDICKDIEIVDGNLTYCSVAADLYKLNDVLQLYFLFTEVPLWTYSYKRHTYGNKVIEENITDGLCTVSRYSTSVSNINQRINIYRDGRSLSDTIKDKEEIDSAIRLGEPLSAIIQFYLLKHRGEMLESAIASFKRLAPKIDKDRYRKAISSAIYTLRRNNDLSIWTNGELVNLYIRNV